MNKMPITYRMHILGNQVWQCASDRFCVLAAAMIVALLVTGCVGEQSTRSTNPPNILFILVDDLGKEWISQYDGEDVGTPHLKQLALEGVTFDNAYVNPQCTPTRMSLITGQYPFRHGWVNHWDVPRWGHSYFDWRVYPSLARTLRDAGYRTVVAGKWQVNDFRLTPDAMEKHGFDDYLMWTGYETGVPASAERYWNPYLHSKTGSKTYDKAFSEDLFSDFLIGFIEQNKATPWFAYYPMVLPHDPFTATPAESDAAGEDDQYQAMIRYTDVVLGRLLARLDELGERDETIVVWLSDNGSSSSVTGRRSGRQVRGGKTLTVESGVNVPLVISAPQMQGGMRSDALVDITDFYPTFIDMAGASMPETHIFDGRSFAKLLRGQSNDTERQWIMAMGGQNRARVSDRGVENEYIYRDRVLRDKRYKLYIKSSPEQGYEKLVDLWRDPDEQVNLLRNDDPDVKAALARLSAAATTFPDKDSDPKYIARKANPWDVPVTVVSQSWKK